MERLIKLRLSNGELQEEVIKYGITKRVKVKEDVKSIELSKEYNTKYGKYILKGEYITDVIILLYEDKESKEKYAIELILDAGDKGLLEEYHDVEGKVLKGILYKA